MPRAPTQPPPDAPVSGLFDTSPRPGSNLPEFTVSEMSKLLKKTVEDTFGLVRVRGEISECKHHSSGHIYITLKDEGAILASVCWRGQVGKLALRPEVGMDVVCTGRLTTYPGQSKYQLVIDSMALAGVGALLKLLEERKKKLAAEGLFDAVRKKRIPYLPKVIGVITSPTGSVIRDILHRFADRFPRHVLVWPVAVQGEGAASQVVAAIEGFNLLDPGGTPPAPDVIIVARGGGSVEDLMPFNEEQVVRAVAKSRIPIISAVGHETDITLIDFAADVRAPTPTAAAEMAVPVRDQLLAQALDFGMRLEVALRRAVAMRLERFELIGRALSDPSRSLEPLIQKLDERAERLDYGWRSLVERLRSQINSLASEIKRPSDLLALARHRYSTILLESTWQRFTERRRNRLVEIGVKVRAPTERLQLSGQHLELLNHKRLNAWSASFRSASNRLETVAVELQHLSPRAVLGRGYALVQKSDGQIITSAKQLSCGDVVQIEFKDGDQIATVQKGKL